MTDRIWLQSYPPGMAPDIDIGRYPCLLDLTQDSFEQHANQCAYTFFGQNLSYRQVDLLSQSFAAYLQSLGLARNDRVAVMLPNVLQYPLVALGVLRAGLVLVNVNPLYTARELEHQLKDSGAKAIVILENFAATLQACLANTKVEHVVLCSSGDLLGWLKGTLVNFVLRHVKKMVPPYQLSGAVRFNVAMTQARQLKLKKVAVGPDDIALLQYTGGTTGVAKGAVLLHRNLVANTLQAATWLAPALARVNPGAQTNLVCALPLYHIFAFTASMLLSLRLGGKLILLPNPRDLRAVLAELAKHQVHVLPAVNTLFGALANHPDFSKVDWSHLVLSVGGGTAVHSAVAKLWFERTGCNICEGYGLSETAPVATCNPVNLSQFSGTIGLPLPNTRVKLIDKNGQTCAPGEQGEIAIKGPQVMAGYWQQRLDCFDNEHSMTADGYFKSGDIGTVDERGYFKVVDRKKDMILVSGFNVYPNEIEEVTSQLEGVLECACVGVADEKSGEAVKLFIVKKDQSLTEARVRSHCKANLAGYKRPKIIMFCRELPKTTVGKILRRSLRDSEI